ncbi:MAG TPA: hypothetical protein VNJ09_06300 [Chthonomonadales bacterium]|nr:hypothetical protein [Chthonomonadales bacterium]
MNIFRWLRRATVVGIFAWVLVMPLAPGVHAMIPSGEGTALERSIPITNEKGGDGQETHG